MSAAASTPAPQRQSDLWDQAVEDSTHKFNYDDSTVRLSVGDAKFRVSRRLLSSTSDVFADMFALPEGEEPQEIVLHNDPKDFEYFLWFLHVDVMSIEHYNASASQQTRFNRALGIATVAHMYSAKRVLTWAIAELLKYLANHRQDRELMTRAYRLASRIVDNPDLLVTVRREWINGLQRSNPADMLTAAKSVGDNGLLGCAYFVIIQTQTAGWISAETSLTPIDRARLVVGALNLRRWEPPQHYNGHHYGFNPQPPRNTNVESWSLKISQSANVTEWDPQQLWDIFTQSPFGLTFEHDTDLSAHDPRSIGVEQPVR